MKFVKSLEMNHTREVVNVTINVDDLNVLIFWCPTGNGEDDCFDVTLIKI